MRVCIWGFGLVVGLLVAAAPAGAQDDKANAARMKYATPGLVHKGLAKRAGEYTTHGKFTIKAGAPAQESDGSAKLSMILGGRFLQEENEGKLIGMPVTSVHLYGYNNATNKYQAVWMYTGATGFMTMDGTSADDGKTVNFAAAYDGEDGAKHHLEIVIRQIDDDHFSTTLIARLPDGAQGPTLETTYTRKK
jgi:Protein of unknown function (DUF1579)